MRIAVIAGPEAGHCFPAIAMCLRLLEAGDSPVLLTGAERLGTASAAGVEAVELVGLEAGVADDDNDAGTKLHQRAARMAVLNVPVLQRIQAELVISDEITAAGGLAADLMGLPWVELNPHPLYLPSKGLPPIGSGLVPGTGISGRMRDIAMRYLTGLSIRAGERQRSVARCSIGLPEHDPGPRRRLIATLPALEVPRPDWPAEAVVVGPLIFEPTDAVLAPPRGNGPLIVVAPSTAVTGSPGLADLALTDLVPGRTLPEGSRLVVSRLDGDCGAVPPWATVGFGRQDELLADADLVICGGGHGLLAKAMLAGVPMVVVPGGGDQWELANRVVRQGCARLVRPLTPAALADAVNEVLAGPRYRESARRAGESILGVADPVRVCHEAAG
ncbi:MAG: glycosyl transferase [Mycobacterium sp.]|nr:glycosyl transferase [Mycobacterium sp.]